MLFSELFLSVGVWVREFYLKSGMLTIAIVDLKTILVLMGREKVDSEDIRYIVECSVLNILVKLIVEIYISKKDS